MLFQVIYLPISNESALFYKSRLATFNFTFYDVESKECFCFAWHEACSKRGASEIATCVFKVLENYNTSGKKKVVSLYSDGCYGQNKNTVMASMLLYSVTKLSTLEEISLRFFETNHGQSEGDSAHSAINYALSNVGDIFVPSQLHPIFRLARRKHPYNITPMMYSDFLDFKSFSKELRILGIRISEAGKKINWTDIMEVKVNKSCPNKIFFKCSHLDSTYDCIELKRGTSVCNVKPALLNKTPVKITKKKYDDLIALCSGETPVVRLPEYQQFYRHLPHEE